MALIEHRDDGASEIEDRFTKVEDEAAIPESGGVLVSLTRFLAERDALLARDGELGVWLASSESPKAIAEELGKISLVACDFPAFNDGRAFSYARLLRERYGYKGELRAIGEVMLEQVSFMVRSGFNTFELKDLRDLSEIKGVLEEMRVVYQPTGDGQATAIDRRMGRG